MLTHEEERVREEVQESENSQFLILNCYREPAGS